VERIFWGCLRTGDPPQVFGAEPPKLEAMEICATASVAIAGVKTLSMSCNRQMTLAHPHCRL
jgi:hypothetical protein